MPLIIGLTGSIASGKGAVSEILTGCLLYTSDAADE